MKVSEQLLLKPAVSFAHGIRPSTRAAEMQRGGSVKTVAGPKMGPP